MCYSVCLCCVVSQWAVELLRGATAAGAAAREAGGRAARALAAAVKDNDFIYHERVPERAALEPVPRAPVAKPLPPPPAFASGKGTHHAPPADSC